MFGGALHFISNLFHGQQAQKQGGAMARENITPQQMMAQVMNGQTRGPQMAAPQHLNTLTLNGTAPAEQVFPASQTRQGSAAVNTAIHQLALTPQFQSIIFGSHPAVTTANPGGHNGLLNGAKAGGYYQPMHISSPTNLVLDNSDPYGSSPEVVQHEGLHAAWFTHPEYQQQFRNAYKSVANNQDIQNYLGMRLHNYPNVPVANGTANLRDLSKVPQSIQTEMNSYLPSYFDQTARQMPAPLKQYYSQFYNPQQAIDRVSALSSIYRLNPSLFPGGN